MLSSKTTKQKALLTLAWVCFFWGTTWLASKIAVEGSVPGLQVAGIRQFFAGTLYIIFFLIKNALSRTTIVLKVIRFG